MTDLTTYFKTDLVDDHIAADVNNLIATALRSEYINTETIGTTRTLTDIDLQFQVLTPNGADRNVLLAPEAITNHPFLIYCAGATYSLIVKDDSGVTTYLTLAPGEACLFLQIQGVGWTLFEKRETIKKYLDTLYVSSAAVQYNQLINGGFNFAQRQTPGSLTTITDNKYSADRWRVTRENADVQYIRVDATGETGLTSKYYGQFKKITNTGKFHVCQIVEGINSMPLRGKTIIFQIKMKASASKTIRMAVLELQNAGTMDAIPATLVTAFGANTVDPTLGANIAVITAAQSKSVTTAWQSFSVSVTVPSNSKNIICAIWTDSQFAANDTLNIAEAFLSVGSIVQPWFERSYAMELHLCQRYYWKSFAVDTAPVQNLGSTLGAIRVIAGKAGAVAGYGNPIRYPVSMFASPTVTTFNPNAANAQVRDSVAVADCSLTAVAGMSNNDIVAINFTGNASTAVGNPLDVHATAEAEL